MHQAAALAGVPVDKGSWLAPRPRHNIKRLQSETVSLNDGSHLRKQHDSIRDYRLSGASEKRLEMRKDCAIIQNRRKKHNVFAVVRSNPPSPEAKNSVRAIHLLKSGTRDSLGGWDVCACVCVCACVQGRGEDGGGVTPASYFTPGEETYLGDESPSEGQSGIVSTWKSQQLAAFAPSLLCF